MDDGLDQKKVWEHYDQLELKTTKRNFKRVNYVFLYVIINQLTSDVGFKLSREEMEFIEEWGYWFISNTQNPHNSDCLGLTSTLLSYQCVLVIDGS